MPLPTYIPLRAHSEFSITDGTIRVKDLAKTAAKFGYPALGLTDLMNTFGLIKFYKACQSVGVKPIMGADIRIHNASKPEHAHRALLLIRNGAGYTRLSELLTAAHTQQRGNHPPKSTPIGWQMATIRV
nr:PHP domain-containing protein [Alysiella crassa]UOP07051.1 PHP domain-containing protein [Alysiella crassa]